MIIILSPSKTLNLNNFDVAPIVSEPFFNSEAKKLMKELKKWSAADLSKNMKLSKDLSGVVRKWHADWDKDDGSVQAGFAMKGEAFKALDLTSLSPETIKYSNDKLYILSGLYGALRPCDLVKPFRLEMGQRFKPHDGSMSLNAFWSGRLINFFNSLLASSNSKTLINLASDEYSKVVLKKELEGTVIYFSFKTETDKGLKNVSVFSKQARGAMSRYILENRIDDLEKLKDFNYLGYRFRPDLSAPDLMTFTKEK